VETDPAENAERISRRLEVSRLFTAYGNVYGGYKHPIPPRARRASFYSFELISSDGNVARLILGKAPTDRADLRCSVSRSRACHRG
jgi:hypothetical protein